MLDIRPLQILSTDVELTFHRLCVFPEHPKLDELTFIWNARNIILIIDSYLARAYSFVNVSLVMEIHKICVRPTFYVFLGIGSFPEH